jgi:hypothetical protein
MLSQGATCIPKCKAPSEIYASVKDSGLPDQDTCSKHQPTTYNYLQAA